MLLDCRRATRWPGGGWPGGGWRVAGRWLGGRWPLVAAVAGRWLGGQWPVAGGRRGRAVAGWPVASGWWPPRSDATAAVGRRPAGYAPVGSSTAVDSRRTGTARVARSFMPGAAHRRDPGLRRVDALVRGHPSGSVHPSHAWLPGTTRQGCRWQATVAIVLCPLWTLGSVPRAAALSIAAVGGWSCCPPRPGWRRPSRVASRSAPTRCRGADAPSRPSGAAAPRWT